MNLLKRFFIRHRFRKQIKSDQSLNVIDGMVKAKSLYKELCVLAHPDRHPYNTEMAEELMKRIVENKHNYAELIKLKEVVNQRLLTPYI